MKRFLLLLLTAAFILAGFTSCELIKKNSDNVSNFEGLEREDHENCSIFTFNNFDGKATLKMNRTGLGEGAIYYSANLTEGTVHVKYDKGIWDSNSDLITLDAGVNMPNVSSGGYIEGEEIYIIFESTASVSGEIIIAFTVDALKSTRGELKLHEHTCIYEKSADNHKKIYTCDCDWLEKRDFEAHFDDDSNGKCDECEYYIGIPHEDHSWYYDVNETSHRQIFECGCEPEENYEAHSNNNGDVLCDVCGYDLSE